MSRNSSNATAADRRPVDWAALVPLLAHPVRMAIIEALVWIGAPLSASDLDKVLDKRFGLGNVSYHLRELTKVGAVRLVRGRQVEHFYRLSDQMLAPSPARSGPA